MSHQRSRPIGAGIAAAAAVALLATYAWAVRTPGGQASDTRAMFAVADGVSDRSWAVEFLHVVSPAAVVWAALVLTALAALVRGPRAALAVGATAAGTAVGAQILKDVLTRPELADGASNSLPSGHVAAVAGLAVAAVLAVPRILREVVAALGLVAVAMTGVAAMALHWHRPSDVLAAALLAAMVGGLAVAVTGAGAKVGQPSPSRALSDPLSTV